MQQPLPEPLTPTPLTPNQCTLLRRLVDQPTQLQQEVVRKLHDWTQRKQELRSVNEAYRAQLQPERLGTLGKLDLFLLEDLLHRAGHEDAEFVKDLASGFPVAGGLSIGGLGEPLPGGQRSNRRPGMGGPPDLSDLYGQCSEINQNTLRRAKARIPANESETELAMEAWNKHLKDVQNGHSSPAVEIDALDLSQVLLVDTFPIQEQHAGMAPKIRVINNFKSNSVNEFAWTQNRLRYNTFEELKQASMVLKEGWEDELMMGKADFKSAFKTLPPLRRPSLAIMGARVQSHARSSPGSEIDIANVWKRRRRGCMAQNSYGYSVYNAKPRPGRLYLSRRLFLDHAEIC